MKSKVIFIVTALFIIGVAFFLLLRPYSNDKYVTIDHWDFSPDWVIKIQRYEDLSIPPTLPAYIAVNKGDKRMIGINGNINNVNEIVDQMVFRNNVLNYEDAMEYYKKALLLASKYYSPCQNREEARDYFRNVSWDDLDVNVKKRITSPYWFETDRYFEGVYIPKNSIDLVENHVYIDKLTGRIKIKTTVFYKDAGISLK